MSEATLAPRVDAVLTRLDDWSDRSRVRGLALKVLVTLAGPLVVLTGLAMLVLPGPGLVVMGVGFALLALEYPWARRVVARAAAVLRRAREVLLPRGASRSRRAFGAMTIAAVGVLGFACTTAVTALLGAHTVL